MSPVSEHKLFLNNSKVQPARKYDYLYGMTFNTQACLFHSICSSVSAVLYKTIIRVVADPRVRCVRLNRLHGSSLP